jgi:hypothetical protein
MNREQAEGIIEALAIAGVVLGVFVTPPLAFMTGQVPIKLPEGVGFAFLISVVMLCYVEILHCMRYLGFSIGNMGLGKPVKGV